MTCFKRTTNGASWYCIFLNCADKGCGVKHRQKFVEGQKCVVYKIPLSCGRVCIGQSGRCINEHLGEHRYASQQIKASSNLSLLCKMCKCTPEFMNTCTYWHVLKVRSHARLLKPSK